MSVSAVLRPQLVAMGVAVKKPSATASFGVPKTSPWRGSVGGGFEYEEKGDFATSTKHFRWYSAALDRAVWWLFFVLLIKRNVSSVLCNCFLDCLIALLIVARQQRYFMRKLKKVKKSNGQVLSINESMFFCGGEVVPSQLSSWEEDRKKKNWRNQYRNPQSDVNVVAALNSSIFSILLAKVESSH
ncbi:unnamed protein product [Prunus armeniaca]